LPVELAGVSWASVDGCMAWNCTRVVYKTISCTIL